MVNISAEDVRNPMHDLGSARVFATRSQSEPSRFNITVVLDREPAEDIEVPSDTILCSDKGYANHGYCWHAKLAAKLLAQEDEANDG